MNTIRFIGDIHGKYMSYKDLAKRSPYPTIQIGDFGQGFAFNSGRDDDIRAFLKDNPQHRFIRGNHDNPAVVKTSAGYIHDGHAEDNMMFVGGAWSIDYAWRTPQVSWWEDEEVSIKKFDAILDLYDAIRPDIMVTHDAPTIAAKEMIFDTGKIRGEQYDTRTADYLSEMFEIHQPKLWIFGHWHFNVMKDIQGTKFVCVNELDWVDVDLEECKIVGSNVTAFY